MKLFRIFLLCLLSGFYLCAEEAAGGDASAVRPNVIVILMDDMGYGDIEPFGSTLNSTPHLNRMAQEGMKLTSFYCAPVCSASRASLLTGCYPKRVSVGLFMPVSSSGLNPKEKTIPALLKEQGYSTMMVGKWHLGDQPEFLPTRFGFDRFFGLPYSNDMDGSVSAKDKEKGKGPKNGRPPLPLLSNEEVIDAPVDCFKLTRVFTEESVKFIRENQSRPFFLYLTHIATHVPLQPGPEFRGKSKNGEYGDWVAEADWSVGKVLETLRELKLDSKTLVIFTSDNGPWLSMKERSGVGGPLRGGKFSTWEGGLREPTIAWWPGKIPGASSTDAVMSEMDLLPTVVRLAGGQAPTDRIIDGKDIFPLLSGQSKDSPHEGYFYFNGASLSAVRSGPWKLAVGPLDKEGDKKTKQSDEEKEVGPTRNAPFLYNLDKDIGETTNVAEANPDVVARLLKQIDSMGKDLGMKEKGPGVRPAGHVENPKPLLKRGAVEYD